VGRGGAVTNRLRETVSGEPALLRLGSRPGLAGVWKKVRPGEALGRSTRGHLDPARGRRPAFPGTDLVPPPAAPSGSGVTAFPGATAERDREGRERAPAADGELKAAGAGRARGWRWDARAVGASGGPCEEAEHAAAGAAAPAANIVVGCKLFVQKVMGQQTELRRAEVLSIKEIAGVCEYYVHYEELTPNLLMVAFLPAFPFAEFRLDEWVPFGRLDVTKVIEYPKPKKGKPPTASQSRSTPAKSHKKKLPGKATPFLASSGAPDTPSQPGRASSSGSLLHQKRKLSESREHSEEPQHKVPRGSSVLSGAAGSEAMDDDADTADAEDDDGQFRQPKGFSKEAEIEKLRTSGSMTQSISEVSRVKNLNRIQIGKHEVEAWYFSPYPREFTNAETVYICEFCLSFFISPKQFSRHRVKCELFHPPGNEIYRNDNLSFFEIDGRKQRTWCRNLCLLSKLFLDHKTVYYDVDPFLFYIMTQKDEYGWHMIGYFSKEKESAEEYNLACILTLPQFQRMGYGKILISFSYELSKIEKKIGSPEKPLSDLGLLSYRAYWAEVIVKTLIRFHGEITIEEISAATSVAPNDVLHTLQTLDAIKVYKGAYIICLTDKVVEQYNRSLKKQRRVIDPKKLDWKPPVFTQAQLR
ncbi:MAG: acyl-CoA N-acyltransferase, partial [Olpidium bornovanus]